MLFQKAHFPPGQTQIRLFLDFTADDVMMINFYRQLAFINSVIFSWEASPQFFEPLCSMHEGAFGGATDNLCVFLPNLGGGVWSQLTHTHLPTFLIHCSEAEFYARAARLLGQHAGSGLQQQISLRRPEASKLRWCYGVKIKQTPIPKH